MTVPRGVGGRGVASMVVVGALVLLGGCGAEAPGTQPSPGQKPPPPEVTVSKPMVREVTDYYEFPGQTSAVGEVEVRARVTGYITKVNFEDGQDVTKGAVLFEIDPRPYEAALERARGDLARLEATLAKAKMDLARSERLRPSGAVSQDEYEQHVAQLAIATASLQSARGAVRDAELNLEFTKVVSPIDGRVGRRRITEGNLIQASGNDSRVLTTVVTTNPVYVDFNIEEPVLLKYMGLDWRAERQTVLERIKALKIPVEIGLDNEQGFPHAGVLDFVDNKVDRGTGTMRARGVFDNAQQYLTPGLYVRVRLPFGKPHPALLVSDRAIGTDLKQKYLLAVNEQNVVEYKKVEVGSLQKVRVGSAEETLRVIVSGIGPEDRIIVKGLQRARAGATVSLKAEDPSVASSPSAASPGYAQNAEKRGADSKTSN